MTAVSIRFNEQARWQNRSGNLAPMTGQVPPSFPARVLDLVCTGLRDAAATLARGPGR
jgi:hypothetical protein